MCRKCDEAAAVLQEWTDKQGHNRCWYYPELFRRLCQIYGVTPSKEPLLPPLEEFKGGCHQYQCEEYGIPTD